MKTNTVSNVLQDFLSGRTKKSEHHTPDKTLWEKAGEIRIGLGSCCVASGSNNVRQELEQCLFDTGIQTQIKRVGCVGMCHRTPLLEVITPDKEPVLYDKVTPEDVRRIVLTHYQPRSLKKRLKNAAIGFLENILEDNHSFELTRQSLNTRDPHIESFLGKQVRIATEYCGRIDPLDIEEYRLKNGFRALEQYLTEC